MIICTYAQFVVCRYFEIIQRLKFVVWERVNEKAIVHRQEPLHTYIQYLNFHWC